MVDQSLNDYISGLRKSLMDISVDAGSYAEGCNDPEFSQFLALEARVRALASKAPPQAQTSEIRLIAEGSPKTDCPLCGSSNLDCEDDAPSFHVHCNGCNTHFEGEGGFAFFDRRPLTREIGGDGK